MCDNHELVNTLEFHYIRDHVFSNKSVEEEMQKDYNSVPPGRLMNGLVEDSGRNYRVIPTNKGFGIAAARAFKTKEVIGMFLGEVTLAEESEENCDYVLRIPNTRFSANSKVKGNLSRYINHSCRPNCHWETRWFNGKCYPILVVNHDIEAGTELTYDYKFEIDKGTPNFKCLCGAGENYCRYMFATVKKKENVCGLKYAHVGGKLVITDKICKKQCATSTDMYEHRFGHHYAGNKIICKLCSNVGKERLLTSFASLIVHLNRSHAKKDENDWGARSVKYPCSYCNKWTFLSPTKWQDHLVKCRAEPGLHNQEDDAENTKWEDFESAAVIDHEAMEQAESINEIEEEQVSDAGADEVEISELVKTEDKECAMEIDECDEEKVHTAKEGMGKQCQAVDEAQSNAIVVPEVGMEDNTTSSSEPEHPGPSTSMDEQKRQERGLSFGNRKKGNPETRTEIQYDQNKMKKTSEMEDSVLQGFEGVVVKEEESFINDDGEDEGFIRIVNVFQVGTDKVPGLAYTTAIVEETNDGSDMEIAEDDKEMEKAIQNQEGAHTECSGVEEPEVAMDYNTILSDSEHPIPSTSCDERIRRGLSSKSSIDMDPGTEMEESHPEPAKDMEEQLDKSLSWIIDTWTLDHSQLNKDTMLRNAVVDILAGGVPADKEKLLTTDFAKRVEEAVGPFLSLLIVSTLAHYFDVEEMLKFYAATTHQKK